MYAAVPRIMPTRVDPIAVVWERDATSVSAGSPAAAFARPKSSTLTTPAGVTLTLAGLRSRWTMPFSCATSSALAICRAIASGADRHRSTGDLGRERLPLDQLEHERAYAASGFSRAILKAIDGGDVWVVQGCQDARLPLEARYTVRVGHERGTAES